MKNMKLNIQLFATTTVLSSKQSTGGSPYAIYTVKVTPKNRTSSTVDVLVEVTSKLRSSQSFLGTGQSFGLLGYITLNGKEQSAITLKATNVSWSGTASHTASKTFTLTGLTGSQTTISNVKFRVSRTGTAANDYTEAAALSSTKCSDFTIAKGTLDAPILSTSVTQYNNVSAILSFNSTNNIPVNRLQVTYAGNTTYFDFDPAITEGSVTIEPLMGNTLYNVSLYGRNTDNIWSSDYPVSFTTYSDPIYVTNLEVMSITKSSITVNITPSQTSNIDYYEFKLYDESGETLLATYNSKNSNYTIGDLDPSTTYVLKMSVHPNNEGIEATETDLTFTTLSEAIRVYIKTENGWQKGKIYIKTNTGWVLGKNTYIKIDTGWALGKNS